MAAPPQSGGLAEDDAEAISPDHLSDPSDPKSAPRVLDAGNLQDEAQPSVMEQIASFLGIGPPVGEDRERLLSQAGYTRPIHSYDVSKYPVVPAQRLGESPVQDPSFFDKLKAFWGGDSAPSDPSGGMWAIPDKERQDVSPEDQAAEIQARVDALRRR